MSTQMTSQTRRILWFALTIVAPLVYGGVAYALSRTDYDPPLTGSPGWELVLLGIGLAELAAAYGLRNKVRNLPLGDSRYIIALAGVELIALEGFLAFLLLGAGTVTTALVVYAITAGLLIRPSDWNPF